MNAFNFAFGNQGTHVGFRIKRVANFKVSRDFGQLFCEKPGHILVNENFLHRNTDLPGVVKTAFGNSWGYFIDIGDLIDNDGRHSPMLECNPCARRYDAPQAPAYFMRANESYISNAGISSELFSQITRTNQGSAPFFRQSCLVQQPDEVET
jgi:hypothetical protein